MPPPRPSIDGEIAFADGDSESLHARRKLGGLTRRQAPATGLRPTVRFAIAFVLTLAWVAFSVWASEPWREELEDAIGPVAGWMIPLFLAYLPALVIGLMIFTLLITRYEELPLEPPKGDWPDGWPQVTIVVAASPTTTRQTTPPCAQTLRVIASGSGTDGSSRRSRASTTR